MNHRSTLSFIVFILLGSSLAGQPFAVHDELQASDPSHLAEYGRSVAISGNFAIVGAPLERFDASGQNEMAKAGAAYIYEKGVDGEWVERQKIVALDRTITKEFGHSVAIRVITLL